MQYNKCYSMHITVIKIVLLNVQDGSYKSLSILSDIYG